MFCADCGDAIVKPRDCLEKLDCRTGAKQIKAATNANYYEKSTGIPYASGRLMHLHHPA
jgi:hypothetical protein